MTWPDLWMLHVTDILQNFENLTDHNKTIAYFSVPTSIASLTGISQ